MDANFFISRAERWHDQQHNRIILNARDKVHADGLRRCCVEVAQWASGKDTIVHWSGDEGEPYEIPARLANYAKSKKHLSFTGTGKGETATTPHSDQPTESQQIISRPSTELVLPSEPKSKDDELIIWAQLNEKPTGICSLTNGKVLFMNSLMPEFCGLAYDQIAVPDIATQFAKRDEREPTDLVEFNERLIKDKVINGSMKAFRTSGAFGWFHGRFSFGFLNGVPVRISEYDRFEVID